MPDKQRPEGPHRGLAQLAARQHGVVSTRQLEHLGYARSTVSDWAAMGRLHRLHRRVYAVGHRRLTWHGRCLAAVLANAPAVASHGTAAWIWGLIPSRPGTIHLTAPSGRHAKREFSLHRARLAEDDLAVVEGIPVTAVPRTFLDSAVTFAQARLGRVLERAEELHLFDRRAVEALLERAGRHPGVGNLRRAIAVYREEPAFTRSGLERHFLRLVKAAGLPTPSMNFVVSGYELDAYWQQERFGVELEVYETHGTRAAFERDGVRQEDLMLLGVETIRITGPRLKREPGAVIERVAAHLARRRRELAREGVRLSPVAHWVTGDSRTRSLTAALCVCARRPRPCGSSRSPARATTAAGRDRAS
ncbi:MAG: type IV toxin-antitoxin system AbiEi family antitoxin domain-containing protein [Solirubrobacterales bacterium]